MPKISQTANDNYWPRLNRIILFSSLFYFLVQYVWRIFFKGGLVGGIYWLFIMTDKLSLPLTTIAFVLGLIFLIIAVIVRLSKRESYLNFVKTSGILFLAGLLTSFLLSSVFSFFVYSPKTQNLDTLKVRDSLYYLTAYSAFDTNYALYQCDSVGMFCKQLYFSNDFMPELFSAKLVYYASTEDVAIEVKDEGEIYRYELP